MVLKKLENFVKNGGIGQVSARQGTVGLTNGARAQ